jgi:kynurenine formamidase
VATGSNWGRWGAEDEAGALNLIGARQVVRAAGLVRTGRVIPLAQELGPGTVVPPHRQRVERYMTRDGGDYAAGARRPGGFQFAEDVYSFATHSGTHVDSLAHAWYDDELYNGFSSTSIRSTTGAQRCGADKLRPMVTRGLLLDVAATRSEPVEGGTAVTADDLARAAEAAGVTPEPGDAVLLHTGWLARAGGDAASYYGSGEPGIDESAARWLADADVAVVGADNYAIEVLPSPAGTLFPVHQILIRDHGVPLVENVVLAELAEVGATRFLFVAAPLPLVGGTAGPVCPVAVL